MIAQIENVEPIWMPPEPIGACEFTAPVLLGVRVTFVTPIGEARLVQQESPALIRSAHSADEWEIDTKRQRVARIEGKAP